MTIYTLVIQIRADWLFVIATLDIVDQPDPWSATSISPVGAEIEGMQGGEGRKSPVEYFGPEGVVGE